MASHPPKAIDMVVAAIVGLKERDGASQEAIMKYIGSNYEVDITKVGPHIRRALKNESGKTLISTKKGLFKVSPAVASASLAKKEKAKASKKVAAKTTSVTSSKLVKPKPPTPKKAGLKSTTGKPKKKGPVSSKPKKKSKGGKKAGKKQPAKKAAGKKGKKK